MLNNADKTVLIIAITSDIGLYLARRYMSDGWKVFGSYRKKTKKLEDFPSNTLFPCDIDSKKSIEQFYRRLKAHNVSWDLFISCIGILSPLTPFFATNYQLWKSSVLTNSLSQLALLHGIFDLRKKDTMHHIVFFAGGAINKSASDISAYTIGKIVLTKMCELINYECPDLIPFIIGPGWTKTKIHERVIDSGVISDSKLKETVAFLKKNKGTPMQDIYSCIEWMRSQPKEVSGGRNISVLYDKWHHQLGQELAKKLKNDTNMFTLRRYVPKE